MGTLPSNTMSATTKPPGVLQSRRRLGHIPARQRHPVALSQRHQAVQKALQPSSGQFRGQSERKKGCFRASPHGRQVAQAARQAAMAYTLRRMPIPAEMDIFKREVGGDDQLFAAPRPQHSAVVANAEVQNPALAAASTRAQLLGAFSNGGNQLPLAGCLLFDCLARSAAMAPAYLAEVQQKGRRMATLE